MKEKYESPDMEIIRFETEDVITTSGQDFTVITDGGEDP